MVNRFYSWFKTKPWWERSLQVIFELMLIGLPLTSFPLLTKLTGASVAPFSAIPLAILVVIWFIPFVFKRGQLPRESIPLITFILLAIALAGYAFFITDQTFKGKSLIDQTMRTFVPFGIGMAFYFVFAAWHNDAVSLRRTMQWISVGGALLLIWCLASELILYILNKPYPSFMEVILNLLAAQGNITETGRLAGFTLEPSWLAHQLNILYLPLWFASTYQRTTVFPRLGKITIENILLVLGCGVFFLTSPRVGMAAFMLMLVYLLILLNRSLYRRIIRVITRQFQQDGLRTRIYKAGIGVLLVIGFIAIYGGFSLGMLKVASDRDYRVAYILQSSFSPTDISTISQINENSLFLVAKRFAFLERTVYWMTGWHIFNDYPILGVGLGNAGFYYPTDVAGIGLATPEIRGVMYNSTTLPNTKSMWYRLLAETGITGFAVFVIWLLVTWFSTACSIRSRDDTLKTLALAGQLALLAFVFEGLSVDTFGFPYLWAITGLAASAGMIYRRQLINSRRKLTVVDHH